MDHASTMIRQIFRTFLFLCVTLAFTDGDHILLISNCISHSHSLWYNKLATLIVKSGHQVVLLDTDPLRTKVGNISHFLIEDAYDFTSLNMTVEMMEDLSVQTTFSDLMNLDFYYSFTSYCKKLLNTQGVKQLMETHRNTKFDLIISDYYCESFLGLVPYFGNPPFIIATAFSDPERVVQLVGHYDNPSYVPFNMLSYPAEMNFIDRTINSFFYLFNLYKLQSTYLPFQDEIASEVFGPHIPSISEIALNASLVMVNTHFAINGAKPIPPAVVPIGGFHIDPVSPLPQDMKEFLDGAKDGAILVSFGSNILSEFISPAKRQIFLDTFSELPQRVLWKFDVVLNASSNVMIRKWLPQNDVLAHPNIVAFISHGGLLGSQEAMYFGVPVLGVPFTVDQHPNIDKMVQRGLALKLCFKSLTKQDLKKTILAITEDKTYKTRMKEVSLLFRDSPISPQELTKYWIEYVLRHKGRLNYLRSQAANLPVHQLLLLDIAAAVFIVLAAVLVITWLIIGKIKLLIFRRCIDEKKVKTN